MLTMSQRAASIVASALLVGLACSDQDTYPTAPRSRPTLSSSNSEVLRARAYVTSPGGIEGTVDFTQAPVTSDSPEPTVDIVARIHGPVNVLRPGGHGFHLHEAGLCEPGTMYMSSGGHHDPGLFGHSTPPDANHPFHMGDLPNLIVNDAGEGHMNTTTSRITLSPGPLSVYDGNGTVVIVHSGRDFGTTGVIGGSGGARIACGIISSPELITLP